MFAPTGGQQIGGRIGFAGGIHADVSRGWLAHRLKRTHGRCRLVVGILESRFAAQDSDDKDRMSEVVSYDRHSKLDRRIRRAVSSHSGQTAFLTQAQILNGNKAVGYWSAPAELFARAGSAVVYARLREIHGIANGFLDASSVPERFDPAIHRADPNPSGSERERFGTAFAETILLAMPQEDTGAPYRQKAGLQLRMRF